MKGRPLADTNPEPKSEVVWQLAVRRLRGSRRSAHPRSSSQQTRRWREKDSNPRSPGGERVFFETSRNPATTNHPGRENHIFTVDNYSFTVHRVMAPEMMSTPGHRASRRRQRAALPAWSLFGPLAGQYRRWRPSYRSLICMTSRSSGTRNFATEQDLASLSGPCRGATIRRVLLSSAAANWSKLTGQHPRNFLFTGA